MQTERTHYGNRIGDLREKIKWWQKEARVLAQIKRLKILEEIHKSPRRV